MPDTSASTPARRGRRRLPRLPPALRRIVRVLIFFLIVHYLLLPQLAGAGKSWKVVSHLNPALLLLAVAAEGASLGAYAQLTRSLLPPTGRPGFVAVLRIQFATMAASHVIPGGATAGAPLGYRLLRRAGVDAPAAGFALGVQSVGSAVVLNVMLWIALAVSLPFRDTNPVYLGVAIAGVLLIGGFGAVVIGMSRGYGTADRVVQAVAGRLRFIDAEAVTRFMHGLVDRFRQLATDRRLMVRATGWAATQWLTDALSLWIFLAALGVHTAPDGLLIAFGLANVSAAIPLTPGGVGVYEAILTSSLVGFGVPRAQAIIGVLAYRFIEFWLPIPIGAVAYLTADTGPRDPDAARLDAIQSVYVETRAGSEDPRSWAQRLGWRRPHDREVRRDGGDR